MRHLGYFLFLRSLLSLFPDSMVGWKSFRRTQSLWIKLKINNYFITSWSLGDQLTVCHHVMRIQDLRLKMRYKVIMNDTNLVLWNNMNILNLFWRQETYYRIDMKRINQRMRIPINSEETEDNGAESNISLLDTSRYLPIHTYWRQVFYYSQNTGNKLLL